MKCTIQGCPGEYEARTVVHTVKQQGEVVVIDHVPAEVCNVCGDVLLAPADLARAALFFATNEILTGTVMDYEQHPVGAPFEF